MTARVAELAVRLHAVTCQSIPWNEDCRAPDGGRHTRERFYPLARAALASADPAGHVHDALCDVHLDPCYDEADRSGHVRLYARMFDLPGAGCCDSCGGTGHNASSADTNGLCWDCRGTGHPHEGECTA